MALEHHPDRNPNDPKSEDRFKEITEAYGVLMDPLKRKEYDRFRASPFTGAQGEPQFRYSSAGNIRKHVPPGIRQRYFQ